MAGLIAEQRFILIHVAPPHAEFAETTVQLATAQKLAGLFVQIELQWNSEMLEAESCVAKFIHRTILGHGPAYFKNIFYIEHTCDRRSSRFVRHQLEIHEYTNGRQLDMVTRSNLGLASVYNLLPIECAGCSSTLSRNPSKTS